ncbi:MAG: hypothetical protein ACREK3_07965 [Gemmatimonadota bacterium]
MIGAPLPAGESGSTRLLWNVYERLPLAMDDVLDSAHHRLTSLARRRLPLMRVRGTHPRTGAATSVIVTDSAPSVDYFLEALVGAEPRREPLDTVPVRNLVEALESHADHASLLIARIDRRLGARHIPAGWVRLPESVDAWRPVPEEGLAGETADRRQADNLRRIRKHGLTARVSHDLADFDRFYHDMYVPFVLSRHGEMAYVRGYHRLRRYMRRGGIMWILREGRPVAGELFFIRDAVLHWVCGGTPGGAAEPLRQGAGSAHHVLGVPFARQRNVRRFDLGDSRPSLTDGVLLHKLRWGATIRPSTRARRDLVLRWPRVSDEIAWWLAESLPIAREGRDLVVLTARPPGADHAPRPSHAPGIRRIETVGSGE